MHRFFTGSVFVWVCFVFGFAWMFIDGVWTSPYICIMYDATSFLSGSSPDDLHFLSFRLIDSSVSSQSVSQTRREFKMGPRKSCNQSLPFCSRPSLSLTAVIPLSDLLHGSTVPAYVKHRLCSTSPHRGSPRGWILVAAPSARVGGPSKIEIDLLSNWYSASLLHTLKLRKAALHILKPYLLNSIFILQPDHVGRAVCISHCPSPRHLRLGA